jgi:hypothetical protein
LQPSFHSLWQAYEEASRSWFQQAEELKKLPRLREEQKRGFAVDGVVLRCEGFSDYRDAWASIQDTQWGVHTLAESGFQKVLRIQG